MLTAISIAKALFASAIGRYVLIGLGSLIGLWVFGAYKERIGYNACKAEWSAAEQAAINRANDARRDGEHDAAHDSDRLQDDRLNRDND